MASDSEFSKEFQNQMGKGRPKGSKNKTTISFQEGFEAGKLYALSELAKARTRFGDGPEENSQGFKERLKEGFSGLDKIFEHPLFTHALDVLRPFGLTAASIGGLWLAEEWIKLPYKALKEQEVEKTQETKAWKQFQKLSEKDIRIRHEQGTVPEQYETILVTEQVLTSEMQPFPQFLHTGVDIITAAFAWLVGDEQTQGGFDKIKQIWNTPITGESLQIDPIRIGQFLALWLQSKGGIPL